MKIFATNPIITTNPSTNLSASSLAGATSLSVYNNLGFSSTTNLILLGVYSDEQAEIVKTSATSSTSFTLSAGTIYPHAQDTAATYMLYDQVEFSRSDDAGVTYTVLSTTPIQCDRNATVYIDNNGIATSQWRFRFYNSLTSTYSSYSASITQTGYLPYQLKKMQDKVIARYPDPNMTFLTYDLITDAFNDCGEDLSEEVANADKMGLSGYTATAFASNSNTFTLPDDFVKLKRLSITYDNVTYYKAVPLPIDNSLFDGTETTAFQQFSQTQPVYYRQDNTVYIYPNNTGQSPLSYKLWYYRLPTVLVNPDDKLDLIFRPYARLFIIYALYIAKIADKKPKDASVVLQEYEARKSRFIESLTRWQLDQPDMIDSNDFDYVTGNVRIPGKLS